MPPNAPRKHDAPPLLTVGMVDMQVQRRPRSWRAISVCTYAIATVQVFIIVAMVYVALVLT